MEDRGFGVIVDGRNLPAPELARLYQEAHAFILPSTGEGWALTLADALASGMPSIWTHWSGPCDYADESTGFPLTRLDPLPMRMYGDHATFARLASAEEIIERMEEIRADYPAALARGKAASERMHARFKWSDAAARFLEILATVRAPAPV